MIRQPQCRNWLHFYRMPCRLSKIGQKKVYILHHDTKTPSTTSRPAITIVTNLSLPTTTRRALPRQTVVKTLPLFTRHNRPIPLLYRPRGSVPGNLDYPSDQMARVLMELSTQKARPALSPPVADFYANRVISRWVPCRDGERLAIVIRWGFQHPSAGYWHHSLAHSITQ